MLIIPAIDIKDGRCVRLYQGAMDRETIYYENPVEAARHWVEQGVELLHVVDLNGAVLGRPVHKEQVRAICGQFRVPVQLGGGLRSAEAIKQVLALGVERAVLGTVVYEDPVFLRSVCRDFPGRIVAAIDARQGQVAVKGWKETTPMDALELARRCEADGAARVLYTDIGRDGTGLGVNIEETARIARALTIPVIASGGVASLDDIRRLKALQEHGVEAVIVGRALYSGAFTLREAMEAAEAD